MVAHRSLDSCELCESHTKTHVIWILLHNCLFCRCWDWRVLEKFEESLASVRPTFLVLFRKGDRIGQSLREGDDRSLPVEGS